MSGRNKKPVSMDDRKAVKRSYNQRGAKKPSREESDVARERSPSATVKKSKQRKVDAKSSNNNATRITAEESCRLNEHDGIDLAVDPGEELD